MKSFFKSKFFYVVAFLTLAAVIFPTVLCSMGHTAVLRSAVNTVFTPLRSLTYKIVESIDGYAAYIYEFDRLKEENAALKEENSSLKEEMYSYQELHEQYNWVSEYLELKMQHTDFKFTTASICGRESGSYYTVFMLDRGSDDGIEKNMTVITGDGVLGYISEVGKNWAKATSIMNHGTSVGVYDERSGEAGVLEGDYALSSNGICKMSFVAQGADIRVGDRIVTGGYSSVYPRGLVVGYVESVEPDELSRGLTVYVKAAAFDIDENSKISKVMVITSYEKESE